MVKGSDRSDAADWSDLEQRFFASAPPDVPVAPQAAPTFDDLVGEPAPRVRKRVARPARASSKARPEGAVNARILFLRGLLRVLEKAEAVARPAAARAARWTRSRLRALGPRVAPALRATRDASVRRLRALVARVLEDLPSERPDGKTLLTTLAALIVVCGLSARVLGSVHWTALREPAAGIVAPLAPVAPVALAPAIAPAVTPTVPPTPRAAPRRAPSISAPSAPIKAGGHAKHHVSRGHARRAAAAPLIMPMFTH